MGERLGTFFENGKPAAVSELKSDERATVNYAGNRGSGRNQDRDLVQRQNGSGSQTSRTLDVVSKLALREP